MEDVITKYWPIVLSAIAFTAWLIRLEAKYLLFERDKIEANQRENKMWGKVESIEHTLNTLLQSVAKIEVKLEMMNK